MASGTLHLAVLIDGDNVSPDGMESLFATVGRFGHALIRNVYGSQADKPKWLKAASRFALSQGRRHLQATGRNATDIEMVIGAMDIMAGGDIDGLCLVSSDSDFTSLAIRIREGGKLVFGFGDRRAPESLRRACDEFHLLDGEVKGKASSPSKELSPIEEAAGRLREAFIACAFDQWASFSDAQKFLKEKYPGFSPKAYRSAGMKKLVKACGVFELGNPVNGQDRFRPASPLKLVKI